MENGKMSAKELGIKQELLGKPMTANCKNGQRVFGTLFDWTSEHDNEPYGESITLKTIENALVEIYTDNIESIKVA
jgi:hypothetical protein